MRILITAFTHEPDIERALLPGVEVDTLHCPGDHASTMEDLLREIAGRPVQVLISWTEIPYDAASLSALARAGVRGIVRAGVGYDNVDLAAARATGPTICTVPDYATDEVADHTMALLLWCLRGLHAALPSPGRPESWWDDARFAGIQRLTGRTLALLGFGCIGQAVARRAQAFGINVRWLDPYAPRGQDKVTRTTRVETLPDLLTGADALSIHCLLNEETRHLIGVEELALMPSHAVLVNTARGAVVDTTALHEALRLGRIAAAAIDVLEDEPPENDALFDSYLRRELPTLFMTPHIAWYSQTSIEELRRKAAAEAGRMLRGERPWNPLPGL